MIQRKLLLCLLPLFLLLACFNDFDGEDIAGKIIIEYAGEWSASINENRIESNYTGTGNRVFSYTNPDTLLITATKLDSSQEKLVVYIYEDDRIAAGNSTRIPEGSATAEYEFSY